MVEMKSVVVNFLYFSASYAFFIGIGIAFLAALAYGLGSIVR